MRLREFHEVFKLRALLEGEAAALAAEQGPALADRLHTVRVKAAQAAAAGKAQAYAACNREFHLLVAQASGNLSLARLIRGLLDQAERIIWLGAASQPIRRPVFRETDRVVAAIRRGRSESARAATVAHIDSMRRRLAALGQEAHRER